MTLKNCHIFLFLMNPINLRCFLMVECIVFSHNGSRWIVIRLSVKQKWYCDEQRLAVRLSDNLLVRGLLLCHHF